MSSIRLGTESDVGTMMAVTRAAFAESASTPHPSSALREGVAVYEAAIKSGAVLCVEGDRVVGVCRFKLEHRALVFSRLCVLPRHRGAGHGAALVDWVEGHARRTGRAFVECSARSTFPDNRPFYTRRGYVIVGYEDVYGVAGLRTKMRLTL